MRLLGKETGKKWAQRPFLVFFQNSPVINPPDVSSLSAFYDTRASKNLSMKLCPYWTLTSCFLRTLLKRIFLKGPSENLSKTSVVAWPHWCWECRPGCLQFVPLFYAFLRFFLDLHLFIFAFVCVFLHPTAIKTTAFGNFLIRDRRVLSNIATESPLYLLTNTQNRQKTNKQTIKIVWLFFPQFSVWYIFPGKQNIFNVWFRHPKMNKTWRPNIFYVWFRAESIKESPDIFYIWFKDWSIFQNEWLTRHVKLAKGLESTSQCMHKTMAPPGLEVPCYT